MTKKIVIAGIIAVAFSVGMIASPNIATAHLDMCAQPSADSLKSVWHALCDLQQQIDAIPTGGGVSVTGFYVEQDQFLQNLGTNAIIMEKQFTVDNDVTVFISSTVPVVPQSSSEVILYLVVDGTIVHQSLSQERNLVGWIQNNLSWTGDLEAGPHTIQVTTSALAFQVAQFNCAGPDFCNLNILVFE